MRLLTCLLAALLVVSSASAYQALDPTRIVPDARVIGLGAAYTALAEGTSSIYTNPAGLSEALGWQITSMSGKFLDEYSYLSFSGLYNTTVGTFGLAYAGTAISGAFATTIEAGSDPADPIYTIDTAQPEMGNRNSVIALSYGNQVKEIPYLNQFSWADRISLGTTLKLFSASLYGDAITGGDASGMDLDLGMKFYPPQKWLTLGLTIQNLLPASLGGKLKYASGHEENYPAVFEAGSVFRVVGKKNGLLAFGEHEVRLMLDCITYPTIGGYPLTWHFGAEWRPISLLTIRAALDQDAVGDGSGGLTTVTDSAFGVGLGMSGFSFDYAYHTFAGMPNLDNHYFSLTYGVAVLSARDLKDKLVIKEPSDKLITFDEKIKITGTVVDPAAKKLKINDSPVKFTLKGEFDLPAALAVGRNKFTLNILDGAEKIMQTKQVRALRLVKFPDVLAGYWVDRPISLLAMQGIITGYPDGSFKPEGNITRAEMCTLLMKTISPASAEAEDSFKDVSTKHWAAAKVTRAAKLGVVKGYPDQTFRPNGLITRAEGLAMVARFAGISEEVYADQFPDIASRFWAAKLISGSFKAGLLEFLMGKDFEPGKALNRAETVEMLYKTGPAQVILKKDLLNWDAY